MSSEKSKRLRKHTHVMYVVLVVKLVVSVVLLLVTGTVVMLVITVVFVSVTGMVLVVDPVVTVVDVTAQIKLADHLCRHVVMLTWACGGSDENSARGVATCLRTGRRRNGCGLGFNHGSLPCFQLVLCAFPENGTYIRVNWSLRRRRRNG